MTGLLEATRVELLKSRRSRVPWLIGGGFSLAPLVVGLFMVILKDPEGARRLGLLGAKAELAATSADWSSLLGMLGQAVAIGGAVLFAFLTSWVYGREFADRTVRGLLAVPVSRDAIVLAKALVVAGWAAGIGVWVVVLGFVVGAAVGLPGWSDQLATSGAINMAVALLLTIALQPVTGLLASVGRGYIPGLAWAVLTVAASQVLAVLGWGAAFPWAVPALLVGTGGPGTADIGAASFVLVLVTGLAGLVLAVRWWQRADQAG